MNYWQPASVVAFLIVESFGSSQVSPQVEDVVWFGDNRGQKQHDWHYDLTYDDAVCKTELKYDAAEKFVFTGALIATISSVSSVECAKSCFLRTNCKSANFYYPTSNRGLLGKCELNSESQYDSPQALIRPSQIRGASVVYLDNIYCRNTDETNSLAQKGQSKPPDSIISDLKDKMETHFNRK